MTTAVPVTLALGVIESVRVAAYRLLAPDQLHGSIQIQTDLVGAEVQLDGKPLGKTPLPQLGVIARQPLGKHRLRVQAAGYAPETLPDTAVVRAYGGEVVIMPLAPGRSTTELARRLREA